MDGRTPRLADYPAGPERPGPPPVLSIVTTVRNGEKTLSRTIASLREQNLPGMEYIVADAGSTDGTIAILKANADIITHWQSEKDRGISDGFNKAVALSRGKYVAILNADDWLSPGQMTFAIETLEKTGADFVFGDLVYHAASGAPLYRMRGEADYARRIGHVMPALNHPTVVMRRDAYERFGLFDTGLRYAMDYDLLLRLHRGGGRGVHDPRIVGHMALEGASDANARRGLAEVRDIAIRHGGWPPREWVRFLFRAAKSDLRRWAERALPPTLAARLRGMANRNYAGLAP